jgi:enamine deaminase RidA (YjgF/YER057c/UK114 family)
MTILTQRVLRLATPAVLAMTLAACQTAPQVIRYPNAGATAVTSKAVEVPAGNSLIFVSGNTPTPAKPDAAQYSPEYWGDTEAQSVAAFKKIEAALKEMRLTMADVVKVQVFLVAPAGQTLADSAGFQKAFVQFFGAYSKGKLPARTVVTIAALGRPGMLVEIEVAAVRPTMVASGAPTHVR